MTAVLPDAVKAAGTPIEIWHQDEARVGQQGTLSYVWADKGSRPPALKDLRYTWAYLFGAVCAERGVGGDLRAGHPAVTDVAHDRHPEPVEPVEAFLAAAE